MTVRRAPHRMGPPSVIHLAGYGGSYPGSFIPMLMSMRGAVESRGWTFEAVFAPGAERHPWFQEASGEGAVMRIAPSSAIATVGVWLRRRLHGPRPVLLHTHFSTFDVAATLAARLRPRTAAVWHLHSPLRPEPSEVASNIARFGLLGRLTDRILCVGPEIYASAIARLAPGGTTQLLGNGIDVCRFAPATGVERDAARGQLGLAPSASVLLSYAWDWERKGGPLLIDAVAELRRRGRDVLALIIGADGAACAAAERAGCASAIRCMAPLDDTRRLYAAADLFVAASTAEGMPFSVLEALSSGTPVVASDIPSHRYVAGDLPACRLAPRETVAFADALERALHVDPAQRLSDVNISRELIVRERSLERWAARVMRVYDEVLPR